MPRFSLLQNLILLLLVLTPASVTVAAKGEYALRPEVITYVTDLATEHGFDPENLLQLFGEAENLPDIIAAISRPAESKAWFDYRPIFLTETRISQGVDFWKAHEADLTRAEDRYGVPAEIIVAILGVETLYGQRQGNYRVLDALTNLAFDYPPRATFFRKELTEYLILTREEDIDPRLITGSYAGAMGQPQFISSSYRNFAVDFDGDGHRDIWKNSADAIGSVAHYFQRHRWKPGEPVAVPTHAAGETAAAIAARGIKPHTTIGALQQQGIVPQLPLPSDLPAALIRLQKTQEEPEYWLGLDNFYVITRYNHSELYAMAVFQLSQEIFKRRLQTGNG